MVDRDLILRKLADLGQYVSQASEYRDVTVVQYRREWKTQRIADRALRVPTTYAEAFEVLGEAGLLKAPLRDAMVRIARFRNILVHEYAEIDPAIVVRILREHLEDFTRFKTAVLTWIA